MRLIVMCWTNKHQHDLSSEIIASGKLKSKSPNFASILRHYLICIKAKTALKTSQDQLVFVSQLTDKLTTLSTTPNQKKLGQYGKRK